MGAERTQADLQRHRAARVVALGQSPAERVDQAVEGLTQGGDV